ncbi:unnamed protein product [Tilletia controversa]|nr:unnamed protein product [Tilletia controversa]
MVVSKFFLATRLTRLALVDKAANIFDIDRNTHDVIIVMADDEDCEIEEDSLPVLHDRERLLVKAVPRSPADRSTELYRPANAQAGPSHRLELPTFKPPPAPSPAVLDLLPDHARDHTLPSPSGSQLSQVGSAAFLQLVMKVETCPNQSQAELELFANSFVWNLHLQSQLQLGNQRPYKKEAQRLEGAQGTC